MDTQFSQITPPEALESLEKVVHEILSQYDSFKEEIAILSDSKVAVMPQAQLILQKLIPSPAIDKLEEQASSLETQQVQAEKAYRRFWLQKAPSITIKDYLARFHQYCPSSAACYIRTAITLYQLAIKSQLLPLSPRNVHRVLGSALVLSTKAIDDKLFSMKRYAVTTGVSQNDLSVMELTLLLLLDCNMNVDRDYMINGMREYTQIIN